MRPRQRIEKLLDPGTPFLELSSLAANMAYGGESPSASSIVGIGIVSGREVMIRADDPTVKGGAWYPLTAKKIVRALDIAMENRLPVVHLCDFGRRLPAAAVGDLSGQIHGRPDFPQPVDPVEARRQATGAGVRPLHGGRRLHPRPVRLQRHRARHRRGVPRRPAAGARSDRRGRHRRGAGRRRHAHQHLRHLRLSRGERGRGDPYRPRDRGAVGEAEEVGLPARGAGGPGLRSAGDLRDPARRHQEAVRHARDHRAGRRRQPLP